MNNPLNSDLNGFRNGSMVDTNDSITEMEILLLMMDILPMPLYWQMKLLDANNNVNLTYFKWDIILVVFANLSIDLIDYFSQPSVPFNIKYESLIPTYLTKKPKKTYTSLHFYNNSSSQQSHKRINLFNNNKYSISFLIKINIFYIIQ